MHADPFRFAPIEEASARGVQAANDPDWGGGQEQNNVLRRSQEQNCRRRLDFAAVEDQVVRVLGLDNEEFRCPLPGHRGIAWYEPRAAAGWEFVCDCLGRTAEWGDASVWRSDYARPLADAYEAIWTDRVLERDTPPLDKGQRLVWTLLLGHQVGLLEPVPFEPPPLPTGTPNLHNRAREFFILLAGLRLAYMVEGDALPMPFADRLLGAYFHIGRKQARTAINALRAHDVIMLTDRLRPHGPYRFLPGGQA
jgi:hypothetical protein